jgi:hypothetical protein
MRIMRLAFWPAVPVGLLLIGLHGANAQDQSSPEVRQACTPDAMRLCSDFIPDVPKITRCMMAKRAQLSRECRVAMANQHRIYHRRDYQRRRYNQPS